MISLRVLTYLYVLFHFLITFSILNLELFLYLHNLYFYYNTNLFIYYDEFSGELLNCVRAYKIFHETKSSVYFITYSQYLYIILKLPFGHFQIGAQRIFQIKSITVFPKQSSLKTNTNELQTWT